MMDGSEVLYEAGPCQKLEHTGIHWERDLLFHGLGSRLSGRGLAGLSVPPRRDGAMGAVFYARDSADTHSRFLRT